MTYLIATWDLEGQVIKLMLRYKQRAQWFDSARLMELVEVSGDVESRLKDDFYRYLFDADIDFVIEPVTPAGGGKPDVVGKLADGRRIIVEAKVYDGRNRTQSSIKQGVPQALRYAEQWNEPSAFLVCFNTCPNSRLTFSGAQENAGLWKYSSQSRTIYLVAVDLAIDVPATSATQIRSINVNLSEVS